MLEVMSTMAEVELKIPNSMHTLLPLPVPVDLCEEPLEGGVTVMDRRKCNTSAKPLLDSCLKCDPGNPR